MLRQKDHKFKVSLGKLSPKEGEGVQSKVFPSMYQALGSIPSTTLLPINLFWFLFVSSEYNLNCTTSLIEPEGLGGTWHAVDPLNICGRDAPHIPV